MAQREYPQESELLALAQAGDERAFALLVARYEPMLRAQVAHFRLPWADAEDLSQEGLLGLLSAVRTFREEGGASFRTYAAVCVRNRLLSAVRRRREEMPVEEMPADSDAAADPAQLLAEREAASELLARIRQRLSPQEYGVLLPYLNGYGYAEIAASLGISLKAVDNAIQRARRKIQALV